MRRQEEEEEERCPGPGAGPGPVLSSVLTRGGRGYGWQCDRAVAAWAGGGGETLTY